MVNFVKPNYLGTMMNFCETFEIPIKNGKYSDSTKENIKLMTYRSHMLHTILLPFVQRRSNRAVEDMLPEKHDFVIPLKMTPIQRKVYVAYENEILSKSIQNLLIMFAVGSKIWNHPDIIYDYLKKHGNMDFPVDDEDDDDVSKSNKMNCSWAIESLKDYVPKVIENSSKMQVFLCILNESIQQGDKVLLFSQNLTTLNWIEKFLNENTMESLDIKWKQNQNYFRKKVLTHKFEFLIFNLIFYL